MDGILERARKIILSPIETWKKINLESSSIQDLMLNYAAPLALIPAVAYLIGLSIVGIPLPSGHLARANFIEALAAGVVGYIFHLLGLLAGAWTISMLSPYFNSKSDYYAALKVVVFSMTPIWLLGIFSAFPVLGILQVLGVYGIYLLYHGFQIVLETPRDKVWFFIIFSMIASILISLLLTIVVGSSVYGPIYMRMLSQ